MYGRWLHFFNNNSIAHDSTVVVRMLPLIKGRGQLSVLQLSLKSHWTGPCYQG